MAIFTPVSITCQNCGQREQLSETEVQAEFRGEQVRTECRFCVGMGERSLVRIIRRCSSR